MHPTHKYYLFPFAEAPMCKENQQITYAVALNESVTVRCEVEAEPTDVTFKWEFSNTVHKYYNLQHAGRGGEHGHLHARHPRGLRNPVLLGQQHHRTPAVLMLLHRHCAGALERCLAGSLWYAFEEASSRDLSKSFEGKVFSSVLLSCPSNSMMLEVNNKSLVRVLKGVRLEWRMRLGFIGTRLLKDCPLGIAARESLGLNEDQELNAETRQSLIILG
ncbi:hemicentin-2 [Caerostris extrusa]|uniref:Hemicentin-2 n=1 Tax=Caerostris extrusa TaxID=172846 RepID=A0AAV4UAT7_CAEEX|nr:hemicentin-2 [Caerostris extrusa]